jgi:hypothetical protein
MGHHKAVLMYINLEKNTIHRNTGFTPDVPGCIIYPKKIRPEKRQGTVYG